MAGSNQTSPAKQHYDRALAFLAEERIADAERECRSSLALAPNAAPAANVLAIILARTGRTDEAIQLLKDALVRWPKFIPALNNLGLLLHNQHRHAEALECFEKILAADPPSKQAHFQIGGTLAELGRTDEAITYFREAVRRDPQNGSARHMLAALEGKKTDTAPAHYVRGLFDDYAASFDEHLVKDLKYGVPAILRRMVGDLGGTRFARALDLGCGSGLVALQFADVVDAIVGVDLSPNMIAEARKKNLYAELHALEIGAYFDTVGAGALFDLVLAADVFIYVGKLDRLFSDVGRALRPGGVFGFSIERAQDDEFLLRPSGRYAHNGAYIERLAAAHGFGIAAREATEIRTGYPGEVFVLRKI